MATRKSKKQTKQRVKKPKAKMRAHKYAHSFVLEQDGKVTCECDPFMVFTSSFVQAKKVSDWFLNVSLYLKSKTL